MANHLWIIVVVIGVGFLTMLVDSKEGFKAAALDEKCKCIVNGIFCLNI